MRIDEEELILQDQEMRLTLAPHVGGAIRELKWGARDLLRPGPLESTDPFEMACFPMVPFVNRVAHGRFKFAGRTVQIQRNWSQDPHPLHGQGWRAPWSVIATTPTSATLGFEGGGDEWPWRYRAQQRFEISPGQMSIELAVENMSNAVMPVMLGLHPYFPDATHAQLRARLPRVWVTDPEALPLEQRLTPAEWRFDPPRAVQGVPLDHCLSGWDGSAWLRWPDRLVKVTATACSHLHVYTPRGRDFFCIEPQTCAVGALGRGQANVLAPGERCAMSMQLATEAA